MEIKQQLMDDLKLAMKEKDVIRKNAVQMARAAILQVEKDKRIELDSDGVIEIIAKEVKKRRDSLPDFEKGGRQDLVDNINREIQVLSDYLPQQLTDDELKVIVSDAINSSGATSMKDMGKIMAEVMPKVKGRADGGRINLLVKELLNT